jgi:hypothetical protein
MHWRGRDAGARHWHRCFRDLAVSTDGRIVFFTYSGSATVAVIDVDILLDTLAISTSSRESP